MVPTSTSPHRETRILCCRQKFRADLRQPIKPQVSDPTRLLGWLPRPKHPTYLPKYTTIGPSPGDWPRKLQDISGGRPTRVQGLDGYKAVVRRTGCPRIPLCLRTTMCYHLITYVEYACGHQYPTRRHYIDCNDLNCRLSSFHNQSAHNCENECEDIMLEDQRLVMDVMRERCSSCLNIATNGHGQFNGTNENGGVDVEIGAETDVE